MSTGKYPTPDDRRCEALAKPHHGSRDDEKRGVHRCFQSGPYWRDGRRVCYGHFSRTPIRYFDPRNPPAPPPPPRKPRQIPLKYQAVVAAIELRIDAAERLVRQAEAAEAASNWRMLARLTDRLATAIDAVHATRWPMINATLELVPRSNDLNGTLEGFDHALAQARRDRKRGRASS